MSQPSRLLSSCLLAIAITLVPGVRVNAQGTSGLSIQSGTQVRVTPRDGTPRAEGSVAALVRDTLVIRADDQLRRFALADLDVLEVRGGEDKRRGITIGALVATAITAVGGGIDAAQGNISGADLFSVMIGNALIGGLIGYAFAPTGWQRLPLPAPAIAPVAAPTSP